MGKEGLAHSHSDFYLVNRFPTVCISVRPQIVCEVKTFFSESPDLISPGFSSEDFYVGIKVSCSQFDKWFVAIQQKPAYKNLGFFLSYDGGTDGRTDG